MSGDSTNSFNPRLIGAMVIVSLLAFVALLAMSSLQDSPPRSANVHNHAFSQSVVGYAGLVDFAERSGVDVAISSPRHIRDMEQRAPLLIVTPPLSTTAEELDDFISETPLEQPILLVLPKWQVAPHLEKKSWVGAVRIASLPNAMLQPERFGDARLVQAAASSSPPTSSQCRVGRGRGSRSQAFELPPQTRTLAGARLVPMIRCGDSILARLRSDDSEMGSIYLLSDPDLLNNFAFRSPETAQAALDIVQIVARDAGASKVAFDVTLHGFGVTQSIFYLAFVPPFVGLTVSLLLAGFLALWQAAVRFGAVAQPTRAIPLSKAALIDNSAKLIAHADRSLEGGAHYLEMIRTRLAHRLHAPAHLHGAALDSWFDTRYKQRLDPDIAEGFSSTEDSSSTEGSERGSFSQCAHRLISARTERDMLVAAQALYDVTQRLLHDFHLTPSQPNPSPQKR